VVGVDRSAATWVPQDFRANLRAGVRYDTFVGHDELVTIDQQPAFPGGAPVVLGMPSASRQRTATSHVMQGPYSSCRCRAQERSDVLARRWRLRLGLQAILRGAVV
jgi:hypothetical protein